jgi:hypothetical protein
LAGSATTFRRIVGSKRFLMVIGPLLVAFIALWAIVPTLAPTVASWDTAEFQTVGPVLGTAHPTGYPAYVILGWLASIFFQPFGDPAFTMNLLQAFLTALAVAATAVLVAVLTGRQLLAAAIGLGLLVMPTVENVSVNLPVAGNLAVSPVFMRLATHADPHMFHAALVAIIFGLLVMWDRRIHELEPEDRGRADKWLVAAAFAYAVAVANHSLALLLPPAIGLFVLLVDWRVILRWRSLLACVGAFVVPLVLLFAELPIRAAMHAPLVYGHPDTLSGFLYVVLGQQFGGSIVDPFGHLGEKASDIVSLMSGWLGPLIYVGIVGIGTSLIKRPRYMVLSAPTFLITCFFSVSYANADIERYFLVPILIAFTWVGLGAADLITSAAAFGTWFSDRLMPADADAGEVGADATSTGLPPLPADRASAAGRFGFVLLACEMVVALALVAPLPDTILARQKPSGGFFPGGISQSWQTDYATTMKVILAPADRGGLPEGSVLVSWWSTSTTLWYGQRVLKMRPDIYIVDDRTRLDDNLGTVQDVFNKFLGNRPLFAIRTTGGSDGMAALMDEYDMQPFKLSDGSTISQVVGRKGNQ